MFTSIAAFFILTAAIVSQSLPAQNLPARQNKPVTASPKGKIEAIKAGMVKIGTDSGESWLVRIPKTAELHVLGTAKPEFLRPGLYVRFKATIDQRGVAQEKIAELKIFTPDKTTVLGVFEEGEVSNDADAPIKAEPEKRNKSRAKKKTPQMQTLFCEVNGQLAGLKRNGQWTVRTPRGEITFALDENAAISLDITNYSYARPGDTISCTGLQNARNMATARLVKIELAKPLPYGTDKKHKTRRQKPTKAAKPKSTR